MILSKAKEFSTKKHFNQRRKGDNTPYILHPEAVYKIAKGVTSDESILSACWLHDTLEDTETTYEELVNEFNQEIADIVFSCSEDKSIKNWFNRKIDYIEKVFKNPKAVVVAWADKMHNTDSLLNADLDSFNVSVNKKIDFYKAFAINIPDEKLKNILLRKIENIVDLIDKN